MSNDVEIDFEKLLIVDQMRLRGRLRKIGERRRKGQPTDQALKRLKEDCWKAETLFEKRLKSAEIDVEYPKELPISKRVEEIKQLLRDEQVMVVCGATGSGKTTQLPKLALDAGFGRKGRIGCTQPRRLAAVSMARRVASELKVGYGAAVGSQVRFDDSTSDETVVKFMTDGILLAETVTDKWLNQYDVLIIDEAHERSLNIDFILGYLKRLLEKRRDLRVVISSATMDVEKFSEFFDKAPIIEVEGRMYPVEDCFLPPREEEDLSSHVVRAVQWIRDLDERGDTLVFLPGEREIRDCRDALEGKKWPGMEVLPLFGRLSVGEQQRVFQTGGKRRVVLSTNVAETSITIPGIKYVVDSGLARISRYDPRTQVQCLQVEQISQASERQRRGRCGRVEDGVCVHLYDRETLEDAPEYTDPEVSRTSLAGVILQMITLGLPPIEKFPFVDPPRSALVREGYRMLKDIAALDEKYQLTDEGRDIAAFAVDPHLARMLCHARREDCLAELTVLVAFLSMQDPRERPLEKQQSADEAHAKWRDDQSDFLTILNLWRQWNGMIKERASNSALRRFCKTSFLNYRRMREWRDLVAELLDVVHGLKWGRPNVGGFNASYRYDEIHRAILAGVPMNIGYFGDDRVYHGARERNFFLFPGSGIFQKTPKWVMTFALVETTRLYARIAAEANPEWLEKAARHLCRFSYQDIHWSGKQGFVRARETVTCGGLLVRDGQSVHYGRVNPVEARWVFIRDGLSPGNLLVRGKWLQSHLTMLEDIRYLEAKIRRPDALLNMEAIREHFDKIVPADIHTAKAFDQWAWKNKVDVLMKKEDAMIPQMEPLDEERDYPDFIEFAGHPFEVRYVYDPGEAKDGATLMCPKDELSFLPDWLPDWLIPGWLPEKIHALIRSLPKSIRVGCNPANEFVEQFIAKINSGEIDRDRPLLEALGEAVVRRAGHRVEFDDFDLDRLPKYMTMRIAVTDKKGRVVEVHDAVPVCHARTTRLGQSIDAVKEVTRSEIGAWPGGEIPKTVALGEGKKGPKGFPALTVEVPKPEKGRTISAQMFFVCHVYKDPREADVAHREGLVALFRHEKSEFVSQYERKLPLSTNVLLTFSATDSEGRFTKDFMDDVIFAALTDDGRFEIRSAAAFAKLAEDARARFSGKIADRNAILENMVELWDVLMAELKQVRKKKKPSKSKSQKTSQWGALDQLCSDTGKGAGTLSNEGRYDESLRDIDRQMEFLFRPGFILTPDVWRRYPRYLKALGIRVQRLKNDPAKDLQKMDLPVQYQAAFDEVAEDVSDWTRAFDLVEFHQLLEEYRIAQFAPELRTLVKVSPKKLDDFLERL